MMLFLLLRLQLAYGLTAPYRHLTKVNRYGFQKPHHRRRLPFLNGFNQGDVPTITTTSLAVSSSQQTQQQDLLRRQSESKKFLEQAYNDQQQKTVSPTKSPSPRILIHWKGEGTEGATLQFRHLEFQGALQAVMAGGQNDDNDNANNYTISFSNALKYSGSAEMPDHKRIRFDSAMQYLHIDHDDDDTTRSSEESSSTTTPPLKSIVQAAERCSLIHAMYQVVATVPMDESYDKLSDCALENGLLNDMAPGNKEENATWCVRVRYYGGGVDSSSDDDIDIKDDDDDDNNNSPVYNNREKRRKREKRHGERTRSLSLERQALTALKPLLLTFGGGVDLQNPDCKLYIMDGLQHQQHHQEVSQAQQVKVLARRIAVGPQVSIIAPATRICVTNTPLCPMAAYWLCNVAGIRPGAGESILDPFAGSCSILLAASMMEPTSRTAGIEIAHNGLVNRYDILRDFETRNLTLPCAIVKGDCTDVKVRNQARRSLLLGPVGKVVHNDERDVEQDNDLVDLDKDDGSMLPSFDYIITDPPYGIRESTNYNSESPLQELFQAIAYDRDAARNGTGTPLLKPGGKLVCFVPCTDKEDLFRDVLPSEHEAKRAGLILLENLMQEQPLNDNLGRWLVAYQSVAT